MEPAKTVRIVYPANLRVGYANIPEAEYDPAVHTLFEPTASETPDGITTPIPADWRDMHHTKIIALAKELAGDFDATADQTMTEGARSIIEAAEADRANPAMPA